MKEKLLEEIENLRSLLELTSDHNFSMPVVANYSSGTHLRLPGIYSSLTTIDGIIALIGAGDFLDCYLLMRRIRDSIMFDSVLAYDAENNHIVIDEEIPLNLDTEEGQKQLESWIVKWIHKSSEHDAQNKEKKDIEDWMVGSSTQRRAWIGYRRFRERLKQDALFKTLYEEHLKNDLDYFGSITDGFTHATSIRYLCTRPDTQEEIDRLMRLTEILEELLISNFMLIKSCLFTAEDFIDALDMGMKPTDGSQYWLAPLVFVILSNIRKRNPDLYQFLKEHNTDGMLFEE